MLEMSNYKIDKTNCPKCNSDNIHGAVVCDDKVDTWHCGNCNEVFEN